MRGPDERELAPTKARTEAFLTGTAPLTGLELYNSLEQGTELSSLPAAQNVAVVVHLFNLPNEQTDGLPTQLVIEVSRGALGEAKARKVTAQDFRKQVTFLDF